MAGSGLQIRQEEIILKDTRTKISVYFNAISPGRALNVRRDFRHTIFWLSLLGPSESEGSERKR